MEVRDHLQLVKTLDAHVDLFGEFLVLQHQVLAANLRQRHQSHQIRVN